MAVRQFVLSLSAMAAIVVAGLDSNETSLSFRDHPRDMLIKRTRDCGTFTMYCGGLPDPEGGPRKGAVPEACANACFYINNFNPDFSTTFSSNVDNGNNRIQSGCQKNAGTSLGTSVCNISPFSQMFHDAYDNADPASKNCDEFPMAAMAQPNFDDLDPGELPRNTLACIDGVQNADAGAQLSNFIDGVGWYGQAKKDNGGRSDDCKGKLQDGDTYKVIFNYDGDDDFKPEEIPFCKDADGNLLKESNSGDTRKEFYMTQLGSDTGKIDFPYGYDNDNRYADGLSQRDLQQCSLKLTRTGDAVFSITIFYADVNRKQTDNFNLEADNDKHTVDPPEGINYESLIVERLHPIGEGDGTQISFTYASGTTQGFGWLSDSVGYDDTIDEKRPKGMKSYPGRYCTWTQVDENQTQVITCWFPCNKPE